LPIYKNNTAIKAFKGDYAPVNIYKGTTKIAGWEFANVSGESLSVSNTYNGDCSVIINGKSTQAVTVVGKNKFDGQIANGYWPGGIESSGVKVYFLESASIRSFKNLIPVKPNTTYTVSGLATSMNNNIRQITANMYWAGIDFNGVNTFTTSANCYFINIYCLLSHYVGVNMQLEEGATATSYTPYIPNSPSPEYPSAINSTANFNLVSYVENLFDQNTILPQNGWVKQSDGSFYVDVCGTVNQKILWSNVGNYTGKLSVSYKVKYKYDKTESASRGVILNIVYSDGTTSYWELAPNWATWSKEYEEYKMVTYNKTVSKIIWAYGTGSNSTWVKDIMIKKSETLVPYKAFNGITINFPYILRSLPDGACDYIEIDDVAKTAKLVRNVGEIIFDGSADENWTWVQNLDNASDFCSCYIPKTGIPCNLNNANEIMMCTHVPYVYSATVYRYRKTLGFMGFVDNSAFAIFTLPISVVNNLATWKSMLSQNPVKVQYKLVTPIITSLSYEAVKQYYPHTNIYSSATVQPLIEGKFRIIGN